LHWHCPDGDDNGAVDAIRKQRDTLQETLKNVYQGALRTITKAYSAAQAALKDNEELTFSDKEIDHLLPPYPQRNNERLPFS
jgi:hypothetical protein